MSSAISLLPRLINHKLAYYRIVKPAPPINLTLSVTNRCNSKCRTCGIWKVYQDKHNSPDEELSLDEIDRIFRSVGSVYFFNISGGEPFLRDDLDKIIVSACKHLHPHIIHVPTNGLLPEKIAAKVKDIFEGMNNAGYHGPLAVKPSFDGIGDKHDGIRGIPGNFEKVLETVKQLQTLQKEFTQLQVGLGTVISQFNIDDLTEIMDYVDTLDVDSYINEIAEIRSEMDGQEKDITPDWERYEQAMLLFKEQTRKKLSSQKGLLKITQGFRLLYYDLAVETLKHKHQAVPCYAGYSNAHISPYGDVWACCVLGGEQSMGKLREVDYDFMKVWHSEQADLVRRGIREQKCYCPLANQSYANLLYHIPSLIKIFMKRF